MRAGIDNEEQNARIEQNLQPTTLRLQDSGTDTMTKFNTLDFDIPAPIKQNWQEMTDLLSNIGDACCALVVRLHTQTVEVYCSANHPYNPIRTGVIEYLSEDFICCDVVTNKQELVLEDLSKHTRAKRCPAYAMGLHSYLGQPLFWPNGEVFGTICVLDDKKRGFSDTLRALLRSYKVAIEAQLALCFHQFSVSPNLTVETPLLGKPNHFAILRHSLNEETNRRRVAEQKVRYQQTHDIGTGLLNRVGLTSHLDNELHRLNNCSHPSVAVIYIGIANSKSLQAKYGFEQFDDILKNYCYRIQNIAPHGSVIGRPGTNDIVVILTSDNIQQTAEALCHQLIALSHSSIEALNTQIHLHTFIGIVLASRSSQSSSLLKQASQAMVLCKDSGELFSYYSESHSHNLAHNNQLETYLLHAVRTDNLLLYFQPKVCAKTKQWIGAEALLRWKHPVLGEVSNEALIHLVEQNGLIFEVGAFALRSAIEQAQAWSSYIDNFRVAVNVSAIQLKNQNFARQVQHLLETYQLAPSHLELEVTESELISDEAMARNTLLQLHDLGVTLALDDFGTGYASFSYLKKYPFDAIKIDKSFIQHMDDMRANREIVRSMIHVAKKLNLKVIVEGIESRQQEKSLLEVGFDIGQGFLYGKPMPCNEFKLCLQNQFAQAKVGS